MEAPLNLTTNITADALIIGAGVSGALLADELTQAGLNVVMIDRRGLIKGATAASTALIMHEIDIPLSLLGKKIGQARAVQAWRRSRLGVESLISRIETLEIQCGLKRVPSLLLSGDVLNGSGLKAEMLARNAAGLPATYLTSTMVESRFKIVGRQALLSRECATLDPLRLTAGFISSSRERGLRVYAPVTATQLVRCADRWCVATDHGHTITTTYVIYATGYEIPKSVRTRRHKIKSTWVIATRPQLTPNLWPERALIWEASDTYLYLRTTNNGRIICGGEDEDFTDADHRDHLIPHKTAILEKKLGKLLPHVDSRAVHAWAGSFGTSSNGLPSIGEIPAMRNVYAVMAYGGNGISFSRIAAEILRAAILGEQDPDAAIFAFN